MDNKIVFKFESNGKILLLDDSLYSVSAYAGLEATDYSLDMEDNVSGYGGRTKKRQILPREIMVEFDYLYWNDIQEKRDFLTSFFNPYYSGTLTVTCFGRTREIEYEVSSFKINNTNIHEELSGLVYVKCASPAFETPYVIGNPIMTLIGGWKWKFKLPFKMKQYGPLKKNIFLSGDMKTPVEIYFKGPAINPKIMNHRTGEYIRLKKSLTTDDTLYINTEYRKKTVEIITGDEHENAWDYLDFSSKFFWLHPGDNMIEYSGEGEAERSKGVEIHYRERFLGI